MCWQAKKLLVFANKHKLFVHKNYLWKYDPILNYSKIIWPQNSYSMQQWKTDTLKTDSLNTVVRHTEKKRFIYNCLHKT